MPASSAGKINSMRIAEHSVPSDTVMQIFAAIAEPALSKFPTIRVTIINTDAEVMMVGIDLIYDSDKACLIGNFLFLRCSK